MTRIWIGSYYARTLAICGLIGFCALAGPTPAIGAPSKPQITRPGWDAGSDPTKNPAVYCTTPGANLTVSARPVIVGTVGEASGGRIVITQSGVVLATTWVSSSGSWSVQIAFAGGSHTINATATDSAGVTGPPSDNCTFTVDATAPNPSAITSPQNGKTFDNATVLINGMTAEPNGLVTVREGTTTVATTYVPSAGGWSVARNFSNGTHVITATHTDPYGNESESSTAVTFTVDADIQTPTIAIDTTTDTLFAPIDPVTIVGTASDNRIVQRVDAIFTHATGIQTVIQATLTPSEGNPKTVTWSARIVGTAPSGFPPGPYTVVARATDGAGNTTTSSQIRIVTLSIAST